MGNKKLILQEAKEVKAFVEKNKKLPNYVTMGGVQYSLPIFTYLMTSLIINIKQDSVKRITVLKPNKSYVDNINEKVLKEDYIDMAKRVNSYCVMNKRVPAYATTKKSKTKVSYELYVYCFAKILTYYYSNNNYPNYCLFNSNDLKKSSNTQPSKQNTATTKTNTKKTNKPSTSTTKETVKKVATKITRFVSKPHLTSKNLGQDTNYNCACNSLQQCVYKLTGILISESQWCRACATTTAGTSHQGIETGIAWFNKTHGYNLKVKWQYYSDMGATTTERMKKIGEIISSPKKAVIWHIGYQDSGEKAGNNYKTFGHYEVIDIINIATRYVRALNSLGIRNRNGSYQGHLQDRTFAVQEYYARNTPGGQKAICIISKE